MEAVTTVAVPMFALLASGWAARRLGLLGEATAAGLTGFVYYFALPALLLVRIAATRIADLFDWRLAAAWTAAGLAVFTLAALVTGGLLRWRLAAVGLAGLAATFGNIGYMGLPLVLAAFGPDAALPAVVIFFADILVIVSLAIALIEADAGAGGHARAVVRTIAQGIAANPILLASVAGAVASIAGVPLPAPARAFGELLGGAALPCALFALGTSLRGAPVASGAGEVALLTALKLGLHPALVWLLAERVFGLDPLWVRVAVVEAALPTAATVFVLAERHRVHVAVMSGVVLASTAASVVTLSALLGLLAGPR